MMMKALILKKRIYKCEGFMCASLFFSAYLISIHHFVHTGAFTYSNNVPDKAVQGVATVKQPVGNFLSCLINFMILSSSSFPRLG